MPYRLRTCAWAPNAYCLDSRVVIFTSQLVFALIWAVQCAGECTCLHIRHHASASSQVFALAKVWFGTDMCQRRARFCLSTLLQSAARRACLHRLSLTPRGAAPCPQPARMAATFSTPRELYPPIEPYHTFSIEVGPTLADGTRHSVFVEECGNLAGKPAVFLHGGPGSGCTPSMRQFFDASAYRVILFDQRGTGRSTPFASLEANTTWELVSDIEAIRAKCGIDKWLVFGGSWGSTLALAYAQTHAERVTELVLRGIFTLRRRELEFFYQEGSSWLYPEDWEAYIAAIPVEERGDLIGAYHKRITGGLGEEEMKKACKAWSLWEGRTSKLLPDGDFIAHYGEDKFSLSFARIESHYFQNAGFFDADDQLLRDVGKIRHIPAVIVQGRYDLVCPAKTAFDLHKAWPEAEFHLIPDAGHSAYEPGTQAQLLAATDKFRPAK